MGLLLYFHLYDRQGVYWFLFLFCIYASKFCVRVDLPTHLYGWIITVKTKFKLRTWACA
jgi:hypothetical protein